MLELPTHHVNYVDEHADVHYAADIILSNVVVEGLSDSNPSVRAFSERRLKAIFKEALYAANTEAWKRDHLELELDVDKFSKPHPIPRP